MTNEDDGWRLEGDEVTAHYSSLTLHRKCPEAWYYRYELGMRSAPTGEPAPFLHAGSWWGAVRTAEMYERGRRMGSLIGKPKPFKAVDDWERFDPTTVTVDQVIESAGEWWRRLPEHHRDAWMEKLGKEPVPHMTYTLERWRERFAEEIKLERPLGAEVFWKRELPRPQGDQRWDGDLEGMPRMWLLGYIDELYEDTERGMIVVRDNKFNSVLGVNTVVDDMMDSQLELYAWGVIPFLKEHGLAAPRAVAYDRARSVAPKPPTLTTAGKLATRNGEPTINGTDLHTYLEWANGPDGNGRPWRGAALPRNAAEKADPSLPTRYKPGGVYTPEPGIVERLSTPAARSAWFQRKRIPLNMNVVRAHLRSAVDTATDIWRTTKRTQIAGEAARNLSHANCDRCEFNAICRARMMGGPGGTYDLDEFGLVSSKGKVLAEGRIV